MNGKITVFGDLVVLKSDLTAIFKDDKTLGYFDEVAFSQTYKLLIAKKGERRYAINDRGDIFGPYAGVVTTGVAPGFIKVKSMQDGVWYYCDMMGRLSRGQTGSGRGIYQFVTLIKDFVESDITARDNGFDLIGETQGIRQSLRRVDPKLFEDKKALQYAKYLAYRSIERVLLQYAQNMTSDQFCKYKNQIFKKIDMCIAEVQNDREQSI